VGLAIRAQQNAVDLMDEAASASLGINRTDTRCLDILDQRGPILAGELAQAAGLSTGAVTTVLDRMERVGFAQRVRHSHDRRKVVVQITQEAKRRSWELYGPIAERGFQELNQLSDEQLVVFRDVLNRGTEFLTGYAARVREMAASNQAADR
jgi:DNA-binding MarR family transcriptional regulator